MREIIDDSEWEMLAKSIATVATLIYIYSINSKSEHILVDITILNFLIRIYMLQYYTILQFHYHFGWLYIKEEKKIIHI